MPSFQGLTGQARIIALRNGYVPPETHAQEKFYIEDGWVFREHHGKYVECICRSEEVPSIQANLPAAQQHG
jgi:hypothetical protein